MLLPVFAIYCNSESTDCLLISSGSIEGERELLDNCLRCILRQSVGWIMYWQTVDIPWASSSLRTSRQGSILTDDNADMTSSKLLSDSETLNFPLLIILQLTETRHHHCFPSLFSFPDCPGWTWNDLTPLSSVCNSLHFQIFHHHYHCINVIAHTLQVTSVQLKC